MEHEIEEVPYDEQRLRDADPDDLYLFMLEPYPYIMTPDQVAGSTGQEIRKLLNRGDIQGCRIDIKWCVPKLGLLNHLNKNRKAVDEIGNEEARHLEEAVQAHKGRGARHAVEDTQVPP